MFSLLNIRIDNMLCVKEDVLCIDTGSQNDMKVYIQCREDGFPYSKNTFDAMLGFEQMEIII